MSAKQAPVTNWRGNTRPCLRNALRSYKAALILRDFGLYPEAGSQTHRLVESTMEAAIARTGAAILDRYASTASPLLAGKRVNSEHVERRLKFRALYMDVPNQLLTPEQRIQAAKVLATFTTAKRNEMLYVDYHIRRPPRLRSQDCDVLINDSRLFYRIVRNHLNPLP